MNIKMRILELKYARKLLNRAIKEGRENAIAWSNGKPLHMPPVPKDVAEEPPSRVAVLRVLYTGTKGRAAIMEASELSSNPVYTALRVLQERKLVRVANISVHKGTTFGITDAGRRVVEASE